jgi:uncharacterized BrkB/YihY/UPF0761 family membrane protein
MKIGWTLTGIGLLIFVFLATVLAIGYTVPLGQLGNFAKTELYWFTVLTCGTFTFGWIYSVILSLVAAIMLFFGIRRLKKRASSRNNG